MANFLFAENSTRLLLARSSAKKRRKPVARPAKLVVASSLPNAQLPVVASSPPNAQLPVSISRHELLVLVAAGVTVWPPGRPLAEMPPSPLASPFASPFTRKLLPVGPVVATCRPTCVLVLPPALVPPRRPLLPAKPPPTDLASAMCPATLASPPPPSPRSPRLPPAASGCPAGSSSKAKRLHRWITIFSSHLILGNEQKVTLFPIRRVFS